MYTICDFEEKVCFCKETRIDISIRSYTSSMQKKLYNFDILIRDLNDESTKIYSYMGTYTSTNEWLIVNTIQLSPESIITESKSLQELVSSATIKRFIKTAKANSLKKLVVYTKDSIIVENLFAQKFSIVRLINTDYEVRADLSL